MEQKIHDMTDRLALESLGRRVAAVVEGPPWQGSADYRAALEEGLRLNRAFFSIRSADVREAIINLIIETADSERADEHRFPPNLARLRS